MSSSSQNARPVALPYASWVGSSNTLVIGDLARWEAEGRLIKEIEGFAFVEIDALTEDVIRECEADIILSPLVADNFDAIDVAEKLVKIGFQGKYRAIADSLPTPNMIRREVRAVAQGLDFDLLLVPEQPD